MKKAKKLISFLVVIIIVGLLAFGAYKKFFDNTPAAGEGQLSEAEIKSLVNKVEQLILVPDETPVIATIIKADELIAEQKFYAGSKNGDYLLVFPTAQKAIIYRESANKIINVGPIIIDQNATSTAQQDKKVAATSTVNTTATTTSDDEDEE